MSYLRACVCFLCSFFFYLFFVLFLCASFYFYPVLLYYCSPMKLVCFLMVDRNKVESDGRRGGEELRGAEGGKPIVKMYYVGKKIYFQ